ncbi:MAG TPA: response regulator [Acidimicrobiales bacterium]|nr:response regulator [Acidimicrobiales bacterium]
MTADRFRVVVADDSGDMRELLSVALEVTGRFEVVARCADGMEALDAVRDLQPDLALLDLGMPNVGGIEVLPDLVAASPRSRVIVVSGFPKGRLAHLTVSQGAVGYVEKSLSAKAMVDDIVSVAGMIEAVSWALAENRAHLERDPRSSATARRFVGETLKRWECDELLDTVNLLVSELVTNSIVHADSEAYIAVLLKPDAVRIEVTDHGQAVPAVRTVDSGATSGRGLAMVEALASSWGVVPDPEGKTVWFEVPRPDTMPPRHPDAPGHG